MCCVYIYNAIRELALKEEVLETNLCSVYWATESKLLID